MKNQKRASVPYRRKREGRTNYKSRLRLLLSQKTRLVIRKTLRNTQASLVDYNEKGDKVLVSADMKELQKLGWTFNGGNMPSSYLIGLLLGTKAKKKGIEHAILDLGLQNPIKKSRLYATLAGVIDAGIDVPHNEEVLPDADRVSGKHIADFAAAETANGQFSAYKKNNVDAKNITKSFEDMKKKILGA